MTEYQTYHGTTSSEVIMLLKEVIKWSSINYYILYENYCSNTVERSYQVV
jgi:hypothetical protein